MKKALVIFLYQIRWRNPYTVGDKQKVLAEMATYDRIVPPEIRAYPAPVGYGVCITPMDKPSGHQLSQETLARVRKGRAEKKIKKRWPLFAGEFMEQELKSKGDYYEGITDPKLEQAKQEGEQAYKERFDFLAANANKLLVYGGD